MKAEMLTPLSFIVYSPYCSEPGKWNGRDRILLAPLTYRLRDGRLLTIPRGYITDLGSIPSKLRGMVDDNDESLAAFLIHDYLWQKDCPIQIERKETDATLVDIMEQFGQTWWRRKKTLWGVKMGKFFVPYHYENTPIDEKYADDVIDHILVSHPDFGVEYSFIADHEALHEFKCEGVDKSTVSSTSLDYAPIEEEESYEDDFFSEEGDDDEDDWWKGSDK